MANIPAKVEARLKAEIPVFQKVLESARDRDVNEADTVVIVTDMLERVFGMDKYSEVTREYAIKNTYVDLAVKIDGKIEYLIEVKAIGLSLKENHIRQAVDYAAKEGIRWVVLTNGLVWEIHRVVVDGQVSNEQVVAFNFLDISPRKREDLDTLFLLCRKGVSQSVMDEYYERHQAVNKFVVGTFLLSDDVVSAIKRNLKKMAPGIKVTDDEIVAIISNEVIKRDVLESDPGKEAQKRISRLFSKLAKQKMSAKKDSVASNIDVAE